MAPVPSLCGREVVRALEKAGFTVTHIRGSHHRLKHPNGRATTVPVHQGRDVPKGTLRNILADVDMTADELRRLT